jgi:hypothetical protein
MLEEGEIAEEEWSALDVIIVSHLLSRKETGVFDCPICYEEKNSAERVSISCRHDYCMSCTVDLLKTAQKEHKNVKCPMCRYPCFLLETPDKKQFEEIGKMLEDFQNR